MLTDEKALKTQQEPFKAIDGLSYKDNSPAIALFCRRPCLFMANGASFHIQIITIALFRHGLMLVKSKKCAQLNLYWKLERLRLRSSNFSHFIQVQSYCMSTFSRLYSSFNLKMQIQAFICNNMYCKWVHIFETAFEFSCKICLHLQRIITLFVGIDWFVLLFVTPLMMSMSISKCFHIFEVFQEIFLFSALSYPLP